MDYWQQQDAAAAKVAEMIKLPVAESMDQTDINENFDPWNLFPLYGTYSSDFDECAIAVLEEIMSGKKERRDLGAEMFRELLCNMELCDYGTSPRVCFPSRAFKEVLPAFIEKWKEFSRMVWEKD